MNEEEGKCFWTPRAVERESRKGEKKSVGNEKKKVGRSEGRYQELSLSMETRGVAD